MAGTEHRSEGLNLLLAALRLAWLLKVALCADVADDAFAIELLLQTAERALHWLAFADFDFNGHIKNLVGGKFGKKRTK